MSAQVPSKRPGEEKFNPFDKKQKSAAPAVVTPEIELAAAKNAEESRKLYCAVMEWYCTMVMDRKETISFTHGQMIDAKRWLDDERGRFYNIDVKDTQAVTNTLAVQGSFLFDLLQKLSQLSQMMREMGEALQECRDKVKRLDDRGKIFAGIEESVEEQVKIIKKAEGWKEDLAQRIRDAQEMCRAK